MKTEERNFRIGAIGELDVGRRLLGLGPSWRPISSIPVHDGRADIDHLLIGPAGVFTINTKNHPDANIWVAGSFFMVNGNRVPYITRAEREARFASRVLRKATDRDVPVRPVIAVKGARSITIRKEPREVKVVGRKMLVDWLQNRPAVLAPAEVDIIYAAACDPKIWITDKSGANSEGA